MPTYEEFKVGEVLSMQGGLTGPSGYGFNIIDQGGKPLISIMYYTESEAEKARAAITEALVKVIAITTHGS